MSADLVELVLKLCRRCGEKKPRAEFQTQRKGKRVNRLVQMYCRPCMNTYRREQYNPIRKKQLRLERLKRLRKCNMLPKSKYLLSKETRV